MSWLRRLFRRPASQGWLYLLFLSFCVLMALLLMQGLLAQNRSSTNAHRIANNELVTCERLTTVQIAANKSHYADWKVFKSVLDQSRLTAPQDLTPPQRRYERAFFRTLEDAVAEKTWTPIIDCVVQARLDGSFISPAGVSFNKRLPPKSALGLAKPDTKLPHIH